MKPLVGFGMVGMGAIMVFGGITGRLAPMLAALFMPSGLKQGGGGSSTPGFVIPFDIPGVPQGGITGVPFSPIAAPSTPTQVNPYVDPGAGVRQVTA